MRSPTRVAPVLAAIILGSVLAGASAAVAPPQIWEQASPSAPLTPADAQGLPPELLPAFRFQVLYRNILAGAAVSQWRPEIAGFAASAAADPVSAGIRDAARVWLARAQMEEIDAVLLEYYRHHVRFPRTDSEFQYLLPPSLSKDPWGQPWVYSPQIPQGFSAAMKGQRYTVAPTSLPGLPTLKEAVAKTEPVRLASTVTPRAIGGRRALEFRSPRSLSVIDPGGRAESFLLLYVGEHWALMSGEGRLFTVRF